MGKAKSSDEKRDDKVSMLKSAWNALFHPDLDKILTRRMHNIKAVVTVSTALYAHVSNFNADLLKMATLQDTSRELQDVFDKIEKLVAQHQIRICKSELSVVSFFDSTSKFLKDFNDLIAKGFPDRGIFASLKEKTKNFYSNLDKISQTARGVLDKELKKSNNVLRKFDRKADIEKLKAFVPTPKKSEISSTPTVRPKSARFNSKNLKSTSKPIRPKSTRF